MKFRGIEFNLFICLLLTTVKCQKSILSVNTMMDGGIFSIFCDASRLSNAYIYSKGITMMYISKIISNTSEETLALYLTKSRYGAAKSAKFIPEGRRWKITFSGDNDGNHNMQTMKIVLYVLDANCDDTATYSCKIFYHDSKDEVVSSISSAHLTVTLKLYDLELSSNSRYIYSGQPQYYVGDNITLTCKVTGTPGLLFMWEKWKNVGYYEYVQVPVENAFTTITAPTSPRGTASCLRYDKMSTLSIIAHSSDNQMLYRCFAIYQYEVKFESITIGII